jgi:uncharacterized protein YqjF (DUF2071 family)
MATTDAAPPQHVRVPTMRQRWEALTFLHWSYPAEVVARHLPAGLELDTWDGRAWVGLVPFRMHVQPPVGPRLDIVPPFPETNVRTYVVGPGGHRGIWFFSLDAASRSAVAAARATYALPYFRADMRIDRDGDRLRYRSTRRTAARTGHDIEVVAGEEIPLEGRSELDNHLTARFALWNSNRGLLMRTNAEHPPWPLRQATAPRVTQDLLQAAGLPAPDGDPLAHFSEGVDVRISAPRR